MLFGLDLEMSQSSTSRRRSGRWRRGSGRWRRGTTRTCSPCWCTGARVGGAAGWPPPLWSGGPGQGSGGTREFFLKITDLFSSSDYLNNKNSIIKTRRKGVRNGIIRLPCLLQIFCAKKWQQEAPL